MFSVIKPYLMVSSNLNEKFKYNQNFNLRTELMKIKDQDRYSGAYRETQKGGKTQGEGANVKNLMFFFKSLAKCPKSGGGAMTVAPPPPSVRPCR